VAATYTVNAKVTAPPPESVGDVAAGKALFNQATLGKDKLPGCASCHSIQPDKVIVGPSLAGIASDANGATSEEGYEGKAKDPVGWLREDIVNPDIDVAQGFPAHVMPQNFGTELTDKQINDLIAYLLTLK
jgi:nitric oxide reductase subunit C